MSDTLAVPETNIVVTPQTLRAAYERMTPKFLLIPKEQVMRVNVDAQHAYSTGLVVAARLAAFTADVERLGFYVNREAIDEFLDRTLAFGYGNGEYNIAMTPSSDITKMHDEAGKLIDLLLVSASALSVQGLLPNERVERIRSSVGYNDAAEQLTALTKMYQDHWDVISTKTGITQAQVDSAAVLSVQLSLAAGLRNHTKLSPSEATVQRERAFTLFYQAYAEVRRLVEFVRAPWATPSSSCPRCSRVSPARAPTKRPTRRRHRCPRRWTHRWHPSRSVIVVRRSSSRADSSFAR